MRDDEFNVVKIENEREGFSDFEFGHTPNDESASFADNKNNIRDEVNDNPYTNVDKRPKKEERRRKKEESSEKETNNAPSVKNTVSSASATTATIVGASFMSVAALSTIIGINLYFNGKCNMNVVEPSTHSIFYELDLTDINQDQCIIKIEYDSYYDSHELKEGLNSGEFIDLSPSTEYHVSVIDVTYNNYILFEDNISTKDEVIPPPAVTYTVTFISNGGTEIEPQVVNSGDKASKPTDPTKADYTFAGWYSDAELVNEYNFDNPVTSNISIYAKWNEITPPAVTYTVTFISNGGTEIPSQIVNPGDTVIQPDDPTKENYYFAGWFSDSEFTEEYDFETPVMSDISLYAKWEIMTYFVAFFSNGGSEVSSQTVPIGETVVKPDNPTKENYSFMGWFTDSNLTTEYDFSAPVHSDLYLYAKWEELPKVTISFETNGGTGEMGTDYQYLGKEYILPECTLTAPNGYVFDCWQISSGDSQYQPGEGYLIQTTASVTFIAVWAEAATVELYPGIGATGSVTSLKVAIGKEYEIPSGEEYFIPPTNQEFDYWFDDMYSEQRHAGDVITIEDTYYSFTAHWKYLDGLTFTVAFDSNGGSEVESQVVNAGTNATKPDDPTKDDYIFKGWYSNSELTNSYNFLTPVTSDITLKAKWDKIMYTISFVANNRGGTMSSIELEAGSEYTLPVCIFVPFDDERFSGWKVNGEGEMLQPGETITVNSDTTLVAGWDPIQTEDKEVIAGKDIFENFPDQPSTETSTIMIGGVEYRYNNISYSSNNETLDMYLYDGFLSTTTPFDGPIKSITVNSKSVNYDLTIVYSDSPINERVTEGGETQTVEFAQDYTFKCTNPDARYFCLSRDNKSNLASFEYIKFVYEAPIEYEYTVYFDANGGTGSCDPYVVRNANKVIIPTIQTRGNIAPQDGYKFSGWKIKGVDDLLTPGTEFGISSDVTLVAQWEPTDLLTVRLDANGGSFDSIYPKQAQKNEIVMLPGEDELSGLLPPEEGYVFDGWSETPDGSSPVSYEYEVTKNVTLYIRWQQTGSYSLGNYLYLLTGDNTAHQVNIQPLGTYIYIKSMKYINDGTTTESRFNVSDGGFLTNYSENQGEIISVTVILSKAIKISVSFSENKMYQWNYDETNAHEYTCLNGDESYEFFPSSSAGACTYYNISAEEGSDYTVVKDIIVKYKIS